MSNSGYIGVNRQNMPKQGVVTAREHHLARLSGFRSTSGWVPTDETGLSLWLDAQDDTTLGLSGSNLLSWADKSGNNLIATAVSGSEPTFSTTGLNGLPTLYTSGAQRMTHSPILSSGNYSAFYVIRRDSENTVGYFHTGNVGAGDLGFFSGYNDYGWTIYVSPNFTSEPKTQRNSGPLVLGFTTGRIWTNGSETSYYQKDASLGLTLEMIGARADATKLNMSGAIGEIVVYDALLTDTARQKVEGYLAHKWNLSTDLPTSHPYKVSAP